MLLSDMCVISGKCGEVRAFAKINLTLDVTGKRSDGYHDILSVMRSVNIYDTVTAELGGDGIRLTMDNPDLPTDEKNIAYRAAALVLDEAGVSTGVKIHISKKIPCGAGMGGGSADGAAVLVLLNRLLGSPISEKRLYELGAKIGADVPFCIMCGTAVASGIGEILTPVKAEGTFNILVVKPEISISTPEMYREIDSREITDRPDTDAVIDALENGNIQKLAENIKNVMEPPAIDMHPVIQEIKNKMTECGALGAMMTGSGSAVFGIFRTAAEADRCGLEFEGIFKEVYSVLA